MKLQSLAVIFVIIILPISLILGVYVDNQIETLRYQNSYDTKLNNATYDALKTFQLNTINNSTSDIADSKIRDIEASVNSFFNSIASNFNMDGYNRDILKEYVPALVYTMYDGYYIYSSYTNTLEDEDYISNEKAKESDVEPSTYQDGETISGLKSYVYYSCRYKRGDDDFVITYSLDNYITIKGIINGQAVNDEGYLINDCTVNSDNTVTYRNITIETENLTENVMKDNGEIKSYPYVKINGVKFYKDNTKWFSIMNNQELEESTNFKEENNSAIRYYVDAASFRDRVINTYKLNELSTENAVDENGEKLYNREEWGNYKIFEFNNNGVAIEEPNSNFNQHRLAVIRYSIKKNLTAAIANYNNYSNSTNNFQMPKLKEDEWDKILNNISIISFLQGLNIGGKVYNGYSIVTNTKNKEVVSEDSIYIVTDDNYYHKPTETDLESKNIVSGVFNIDLERKSRTISMTAKYFYPNTALASYASVVNQTEVEEPDNIYDYMESKGGELAKAYFTALGRERYSMYRTSNDSDKLKALFSE